MQKIEYILNEETSRIIGIGIEIHKILGPGFLEIVYKDAFEYEFSLNNIFSKGRKNIKFVISSSS